jgi:hypothetical protein
MMVSGVRSSCAALAVKAALDDKPSYGLRPSLINGRLGATFRVRQSWDQRRVSADTAHSTRYDVTTGPTVC